MKNKLLLLIAILISFQSVAQDPELLREWRLLYMEVDGVVHDAPQPEWPWVDPKLYLGTDFYSAQIDGCDDILGGTVTYDTPNSSITTSDHGYLVGKCEPIYPAYTAMYYEFLANYLINNDPKTFEYEIIFNPDGSKTLILTDTDNDRAVYNSELLRIDQLSKVNFKVYPNPVSNTLYISSESLQIERLTIFSVSGQVVFSEENDTNSVDVSGLSEGVYFVEISSEKEKSIQKFIKQ
jgi:hypothetical protein